MTSAAQATTLAVTLAAAIAGVANSIPPDAPAQIRAATVAYRTSQIRDVATMVVAVTPRDVAARQCATQPDTCSDGELRALLQATGIPDNTPIALPAAVHSAATP